MYPKPIPPPLFVECEVECCPSVNGEECEYCIGEDLDDTLDSGEERADDNGEESKDN
jgi:hypothetical protein